MKMRFQDLKKLGLKQLDDSISDEDTLILRTHGTEKEKGYLTKENIRL